jgi:signal transduction histidine kinase
MLGRLQILRSKAALGRVLPVSDVDVVIGSVQRLSRLTSDLLDIGRLDQGLFTLKIQPVDLAEIARVTAAALTTPSTPIEVEAPAEIVILGDGDRLQQALENVVSNAMKYSPSGEPVRLRLGLVDDGDAPRCQLDVIDRGPGIPPEIRPHLFGRYSAGKGSAGLGLGLYLACEIAKSHGGKLIVDSKPGEGALFRFELPVDAASSTASAT